jgi:hypothetical protein
MAEEEKRLVPIRADAIPTDGYILTVDGKMKRRYETEKDATTEATKLKQRFPVVQISVYDAAASAYTIVNTQEQ